MLKAIRKALLIAAVSLVPAAGLFAGDITVSAQVDKNVVSLDDQLVLQVQVSGSGSVPNPQLPDLADFSAYSSGRSQNISIVNGQMSSSVTFSYTLVPKTTGKFTLGAVTLQQGGKTYRTEPIPVEVVAAGKAPGPSAGRAPAGASAAAKDRSLFVTASLDKTTAYVNEQVVYTFRFYTSVRLLSNPGYQPPDFTGFWTEDMPPKNYYATVDGRQYLVSEVKMLLFPAKAGAIDLGRAALQCRIEDFSQADPFSDDFFRGFFSGGRAQTLQSGPLSVRVLPLPGEGKPADFSGAVGDFTVSASLDKTSAKVNEPVTLTVKVSGGGNIKTIAEPKLPDWPDFRKYETVSSLNLDKNGEALRGSKEFKTVIVPLTQGKKTIPSFAFSFFDPKGRKYRSGSTAPLSLEVLPGPAAVAPAPGPREEKGNNGVQVVTRDINYLKSLDRWEDAPGALYRNPLFLFANAAPLAFLAFAFLYLRRREKLSLDVAYARRLAAPGAARRYLKKAKALLDPGRSHDYYGAVSRALLEYAAHKLNVSADGLTTDALAGMLEKRGASAGTVRDVREILDECNLVRFAPTAVTREMMETAFNRAGDAIRRLEKELT